jgi:hypothetical protein
VTLLGELSSDALGHLVDTSALRRRRLGGLRQALLEPGDATLEPR